MYIMKNMLFSHPCPNHQLPCQKQPTVTSFFSRIFYAQYSLCLVIGQDIQSLHMILFVNLLRKKKVLKLLKLSRHFESQSSHKLTVTYLPGIEVTFSFSFTIYLNSNNLNLLSALCDVINLRTLLQNGTVFQIENSNQTCRSL